MNDKTDLSPNQKSSASTHNRFVLLFVLLLQQLLGALTFPIAKFGLQQVEPFTFAFYRFTISGIILIFIARLRNSRPPVEKKDFLKIVGLGCLIVVLNQTTYLYGQKLTGAGHASLLFATVPIWIFIGGMIFLKEKFVKRRALGVGIGLLGVVVVLAAGAIEISREYLLGDVIIIVAVLVWVMYTIFGKPLVMKYGALRTTAYALASGSAVYFPFGLYRAIIFDYSGVTAGAWFSIIYVALGVSIGSYVLWYWLIKNMDVTRVAVFHNLGPIIATSVAVLFLGEPLTWSFIVGGGHCPGRGNGD